MKEIESAIPYIIIVIVVFFAVSRISRRVGRGRGHDEPSDADTPASEANDMDR